MHGLGDVRFFDQLAGLYDVVMPAADRNALEAGLARAEGSVDRLLDVGGGTGRATIAVDVAERVVLDVSRGMLRRARRRGVDRSGRWRLRSTDKHAIGPLSAVQGDGSRMPIADDGVDAVIVVDAFHHMPAQRTVLAEARRVLRPGGVLVVREFDPTHPLGWLLARGERLIGMDSTFHSPATLAAMASEAGFSVSVLDAGFEYTMVGTNR